MTDSYTCEFCKTTFSSNGNLRTHQKKAKKCLALRQSTPEPMSETIEEVILESEPKSEINLDNVINDLFPIEKRYQIVCVKLADATVKIACMTAIIDQLNEKRLEALRETDEKTKKIEHMKSMLKVMRIALKKYVEKYTPEIKSDREIFNDSDDE